MPPILSRSILAWLATAMALACSPDPGAKDSPDSDAADTPAPVPLSTPPQPPPSPTQSPVEPDPPPKDANGCEKLQLP